MNLGALQNAADLKRLKRLKYKFDYSSDPASTIVHVAWKQGRVVFKGLRESDESDEDHGQTEIRQTLPICEDRR